MRSSSKVRQNKFKTFVFTCFKHLNENTIFIMQRFHCFVTGQLILIPVFSSFRNCLQGPRMRSCFIDRKDRRRQRLWVFETADGNDNEATQGFDFPAKSCTAGWTKFEVNQSTAIATSGEFWVRTASSQLRSFKTGLYTKCWTSALLAW